MSKKQGAWITVRCAVCGKTFEKRACWAKRTKNHYCSYECNGVHRGQEWKKHGHKGRAGWTEESERAFREKMSGESNPAWKGGVTYFKTHGNYTGVRYVRAPEWALPMARKDGYIMEHRLIMAEHLGRLLTRQEVIHHKNHDPSDNRISNLELWPSNGSHKKAEHGKIAPGAACRLSPKKK